MAYEAMLTQLLDPPKGLHFQYKNQESFDYTDLWNSNGEKKHEELNRDRSSYLLYKVTPNDILDSYKKH